MKKIRDEIIIFLLRLYLKLIKKTKTVNPTISVTIPILISFD